MKRQRTDGGKNGSHSLMGASTTTGSGQSDSRNGKRNNASCSSPDKIKSSYTKLEPIRVIGSGSFGKYHDLLSFFVLGCCGFALGFFYLLLRAWDILMN